MKFLVLYFYYSLLINSFICGSFWVWQLPRCFSSHKINVDMCSYYFFPSLLQDFSVLPAVFTIHYLCALLFIVYSFRMFVLDVIFSEHFTFKNK